MLMNKIMDQRDDDVRVAVSLEVARAVQYLHNAAVYVESRNLDMFRSCNPPSFMGTHEPDGAQEWLKRIEKIFRLITCSEEQKVVLGTFMLEEEAENWWVHTSHWFREAGIVITWTLFKDAFLAKYFSEDVRKQKEMEFFELKQEGLSVEEYASKFEELATFLGFESFKCMKFVDGLRPEIRPGMEYPKIQQFSVLVNKSQNYDEECRARFTQYQDLSDQKGKRKVTYEEKRNGESVNFNSMRCLKCGDTGHRASACLIGIHKCFNCGLAGHVVADCRSEVPTCYNCGELGHQMFECAKAVMPYAKRCYKCDGLGHKMQECVKVGIKCFRCERVGHIATDCKDKVVTCFNCGELGHISKRCPRPMQVQVGGEAVAGTGSQFASADR